MSLVKQTIDNLAAYESRSQHESLGSHDTLCKIAMSNGVLKETATSKDDRMLLKLNHRSGIETVI